MIKLIYEYDGIKITHELPDHIGLTELLEEFSNFVKAMGYHFTGSLEIVEEDDRETVDDIYQEGYKDGIETALREIKNGTFNPSDHGISGDELDIDDGYMLDGIKARSTRCEQERSELRTMPGNDTDSSVCCEAPQYRYDEIRFPNGNTRFRKKCANCGTILELSNEEVSE